MIHLDQTMFTYKKYMVLMNITYLFLMNREITLDDMFTSGGKLSDYPSYQNLSEDYFIVLSFNGV